MSRPRLLDLFCGAGGCSVGYDRAGFEVVGVDINPQPNYPFKFWQHDALTFLQLDQPQDAASNFDAIHASPPCQQYTTMNNRFPSAAAKHPDLIGPTKDLLRQAGLPFVVENVGGARRKLNYPVRICGCALGLSIGRHRYFECDGFHAYATDCKCDGKAAIGVYGKMDGRRLLTRANGSTLRAARTLDEARAAMGIDWMGWDEIREAIPPTYTEHIGGYLMAEVLSRQTERAA